MSFPSSENPGSSQWLSLIAAVLHLRPNADFRGNVRIRRNGTQPGGEMQLELWDVDTNPGGLRFANPPYIK